MEEERKEFEEFLFYLIDTASLIDKMIFENALFIKKLKKAKIKNIQIILGMLGLFTINLMLRFGANADNFVNLFALVSTSLTGLKTTLNSSRCKEIINDTLAQFSEDEQEIILELLKMRKSDFNFMHAISNCSKTKPQIITQLKEEILSSDIEGLDKIYYTLSQNINN